VQEKASKGGRSTVGRQTACQPNRAALITWPYRDQGREKKRVEATWPGNQKSVMVPRKAENKKKGRRRKRGNTVSVCGLHCRGHANGTAGL